MTGNYHPGRMDSVGERVDGAIDDAVAALREGRRAAVHLRGGRGAGKTWSMDRAARRLTDAGVRVLRTGGAEADRAIPFSALSTLLRSAVIASADEWPALRAAVTFMPGSIDPVQVTTEAHRLLSLLGSAGPLALLVDDVHLVDPISADAMWFASRRAEALVVLTAGPDVAADSTATELRVGDVPLGELVALLEARGLARGAADACAAAANGNPGLALALADGLSPEQRVGAVPMAALPRPAGGLADELLRRLRAHGEQVSRALVVAAAEPGGDGAAVRSALRVLGESDDGLVAAEDAGLVEVVGTRLLFPDPWTRSAAYHLVAPASRRAAHRALATAFTEPGQAAQRAWHLAAGADGPSQAVAEALLLLADDTARRGATAAAATMAERAAEFAPDRAGRTACLLSALERWIDTAGIDGVRRVVAVLERTDPEVVAAVAEAESFIRGGVDSAVSAEGDGPWARRRRGRLQVLASLERGDHRAAMAGLGAVADSDPRGHVAAALAHRHAGRLKEAREGLTRAALVLEGVSCAAATWATLVGVDLDVLQGRADEAASVLAQLSPSLPAEWLEWASCLRARASLATDMANEPAKFAAAFAAPASGPLAEVRALVADGVRSGGEERFRQAIALAEQHELPIEAAEARMWWASLPGADPRSADLAMATLQRCGSRGWETRLRAAAAIVPAVPVPAADPALDALSQAERRVAEAVARGLTNREVADHLYLSVKTVDFHLQQMYRKLGIRSRTELAVRMAGYLPPTTGERG